MHYHSCKLYTKHTKYALNECVYAYEWSDKSPMAINWLMRNFKSEEVSLQAAHRKWNQNKTLEIYHCDVNEKNENVSFDMFPWETRHILVIILKNFEWHPFKIHSKFQWQMKLATAAVIWNIDYFTSKHQTYGRFHMHTLGNICKSQNGNRTKAFHLSLNT